MGGFALDTRFALYIKPAIDLYGLTKQQVAIYSKVSQHAYASVSAMHTKITIKTISVLLI